MPTIKFVRVERDCQANRNRRAVGDRGITYDFDVMIDGERRAQLRREPFTIGYRLKDADGRPIGADHQGFHVRKKSRFEKAVADFLEAGSIPTLARMTELRAEEAAALQAKRAEVAERYRTARIEAAGVQLYDALKAALEMLDQGNARNASVLVQCRAAIAQAEITHPTDAEQIEYEARHR